jgi:hypothetical protein
MKLKAPVRLNRKPGRLSRPRSRLKILLAVGTATVGVAGLAVALAGPVSADPSVTYVAVGADTTQDVMNQWAVDEGSNLIGSYNAVDPVTGAGGEVITPNNAAGGQCSFTRPDGSTQGLDALLYSVYPQTTAPQLADPPQSNCIDIARSWSGPGTDQADDGALVYIPFALDAVAGATGSSTAITTASDFTLTDLKNLYASCENVTEGGVTYNPNGTASGGQVAIHLYVPPSASDTLGRWAATLGFSATALPSCVHQTIQAGPEAGQPVAENDGTAVASDPNGYLPFSVADWISQRNGNDDHRNGAVLNEIGGVSPFSNGNPATGTLNTSFPTTGEVYNVVPYDDVAPGEPAYNQQLAQLLAGTGSVLCRDVLTIVNHGFALLSSSTTDQCGSTADSLRAFDPDTSPSGPSSVAAPSSPPVTWCESGLPASPYTSAPAGAVTVPAGDDSAVNFSTADTTYWFAPGVHTLGTDVYNQIDPADGDTYVGAPGAVIDGQNDNEYAFEGMYNDLSDENVTIEYLTIQDFSPNQGGGAVNGNGNNGWTEKYDLMQDNSPGAAMMLGGDNVVSDNCLTENGEYGFNGASYVDETYGSTFTGGATNITFTDNDIADNNTQKTQSGIEGGGKFWQDGDVVVTGNYVHGNIESPGLWMDTDNAGFLVQDNYFADNGGEGLMYEISYNADIIDNTFADNGIYGGEGNEGFPTGAIYVSESGGNSSVPSTYAGELNIQDNVFQDNWGGVVVYQNSNRYSGDGQDPGTLTPPSGTSVDTWINSAQTTCPANLSETSPVDYNSLCQWRSQDVTVQDNTFEFNPSDSIFGGQCTEDNSCGQNGLFSIYSSTSAYPGYSVCNNISNNQDNVFQDNAYTGPWTFVYFNQGDTEGPSDWQAGATNVQGSGYNFGAQDQGSTFSP